jgi:hypothetical protein
MGIISGIGVLAAGLAWLRRRRKQNAATRESRENFPDCISIEEKAMTERPYCGSDGSQIVEQIAQEMIEDSQLRQRWMEFDHRFLEQCVMAGEQGLVFNREGAAVLGELDEELLRLGVKIYNAANREAVRQRSNRYRVFNLLAMIYHIALRACQ